MNPENRLFEFWLSSARSEPDAAGRAGVFGSGALGGFAVSIAVELGVLLHDEVPFLVDGKHGGVGGEEKFGQGENPVVVGVTRLRGEARGQSRGKFRLVFLVSGGGRGDNKSSRPLEPAHEIGAGRGRSQQ